MTDRLAYALVKAKGWLAWQVVRWFPLPLWSKGTLRWRLSARLWGLAYTAGAFPSFQDYRDWMCDDRSA